MSESRQEGTTANAHREGAAGVTLSLWVRGSNVQAGRCRRARAGRLAGAYARHDEKVPIDVEDGNHLHPLVVLWRERHVVDARDGGDRLVEGDEKLELRDQRVAARSEVQPAEARESAPAGGQLHSPEEERGERNGRHAVRDEATNVVGRGAFVAQANVVIEVLAGVAAQLAVGPVVAISAVALAIAPGVVATDARGDAGGADTAAAHGASRRAHAPVVPL